MSTPQHRGGKVYCRKRYENLPIGNVAGRGHGSGIASRVIATLLLSESALRAMQRRGLVRKIVRREKGEFVAHHWIRA